MSQRYPTQRPTGAEQGRSGEAAFGEAAIRNYRETRLRFFDHYLKGEDTWNEAAVQFFRMGTGDGSRYGTDKLFHGGEWETAGEWPPADADPTKFYAHPDGSLSCSPPNVESAGMTYAFDSDDPVPTIGGNCSSYVTYEPREESVLELPLEEHPSINITGSGGFDQRTWPDTFGAEPPYGPPSIVTT